MAFDKTVPLASLTMPVTVLSALEIVKVWEFFGMPESVRVQLEGQPDILSSSGFGIAQAGEGGGPIIIPFLGIDGPIPTNHIPLLLVAVGIGKLAMTTASKALVLETVKVWTVKFDGPPAKTSIFSPAVKVLAEAVKLIVRVTAEEVAVRIKFLLIMLVEVALTGAGSIEPK